MLEIKHPQLTRPAAAPALPGISRAGALRLLALVLALLLLVPMFTRWRDLLAAVRLLGPLLLPLAALHALPILLDSRGWLALLRSLGFSRASGAGYIWGVALVREAVATCLPLSGVGAFAAALRLLALRGLRTADALASVVAESTLTLLTQTGLLLLAAGAWLLLLPASPQLRAHYLVILAASVACLCAVLALQRDRRLPRLFERLLRRLGGVRAGAVTGPLEALYLRLERIYARPGVCARAACWQLAALAAAVAELWLMLSVLGVPHAPLLALSLSGAARLARSLAWLLPAGLGAQELAFGGLLMGAGLEFEAGVAISVATRARDLLFGAPVLLGWLLLERVRGA